MKEKQLSWAVEGNSLRTRARRGGRIALKGFEYQASHALHFLARLLICEGGIVQVRYEGAQDIDTMYGNGQQIFIQCKDTPEKKYDFESVRSILHGFMCDAIDACGVPPDVKQLEKLQLKFVLVSSGVISGAEMLRLIRGSYSDNLAKKLLKGFNYVENPPKPEDTLAYAKYVVQNTSLRLSPQLEGQQHDQETFAFAKLAMFGVPPAHIQASLESLKGLLTPPRNVFASDAAAVLQGLPDYHPASGRSPISLLPSENSFHDLLGVEREFRESGRVSWAAINYGLDARRDCYQDICSSIITMGRKAAVVLVTGSSASGKSTVVRRVGWDLFRTGHALVFEVVEPQNLNLEVWSEVARLGEITCKPVIIICDELDSESGILEQLRLQPQVKVIVLASAKSENVIPTPFPVYVSSYKLDSVSIQEFNQLADEIGLNDRAIRPAKFSTLMRAGDIFALSLSLRGSSLDKIADGILERLQQVVPDLYPAFLCLCACGAYDQSAPRRLLVRMIGRAELLVLAQDQGFIFVEVDDRVRSGHATLASAILRRAGANPIDLKMQLLRQVNISDARERRFGLGLLKNGLGEHASELASFTSQLSCFAEGLADDGDYLDIARGLDLFDILIAAGVSRLADSKAKLLAAKGPDRVRTGHDAVRFMSEADDYNVAFPVVARVFAQPGISFGRNAFMRWVMDKGTNHIEEQRVAIAVNFKWLHAAGFPASETTKLLDCIGLGSPRLPIHLKSEYAEILAIVLNAMPLPPPNAAAWEMLYTFCSAIEFRIRDEALVECLVDRLERHFDLVQLAENPRLLRHLATAATLACGWQGKQRVFRLLVSTLPNVAADTMFKVYLALLRLLSETDKLIVLAWQDRLKSADSDMASATAKAFVEALPSRLKPVP